MKIAICDDESVFANELETMIRNLASSKDLVVLIKKYTHSKELLASDLADCDVVFLDIDMPELNGLEVAKVIRERYPELILVFVTGWIEYAPAGYRVNAFRYLLKSSLSDELPLCIDEIREKLTEDATLIEIVTRDRTMEVAVRNILYFEGTARRFVIMHLKQGGPPVACVGKLADYEQRLRDFGFLRLQRSYLANMNYIEKIKNYHAVMTDGSKLKVSERQYAEICKRFLMWRGQIR